jgi:hypothetical protein
MGPLRQGVVVICPRGVKLFLEAVYNRTRAATGEIAGNATGLGAYQRRPRARHGLNQGDARDGCVAARSLR